MKKLLITGNPSNERTQIYELYLKELRKLEFHTLNIRIDKLLKEV